MEVSPERYAPHLSEFYSMINKKTSKQNLGQNGTADTHDSVENNMDPVHHNLRRPSSIRSGTSTSSMMDLRALITRDDMIKTQNNVKGLIDKITRYSAKLNELAQFSTEIAFQLEDMAHLKGCSDITADKFINASGLFHLVSNHDRIISNCCEEVVIKNLNVKVEQLGEKYKGEEIEFKKQFKEQSIKLKLQEKYNLNLSKRKVRNLVSYRENLSLLQRQLDELELLKHDHYQKSYDMVESTCQVVLRDVATLARAQIEISENIARKGWSGGGLDNLIVDADDPFSTNKDDDVEATIADLPRTPAHTSPSTSGSITPIKDNKQSQNECGNLNLPSNNLQSPIKMKPESNHSGGEHDYSLAENGAHSNHSSETSKGETEDLCHNTDVHPGEQSDCSITNNIGNDYDGQETFDNSFSLPVTGSSNKEIESDDIHLSTKAGNILEATDEVLIEDQSSLLSRSPKN